MGRFDRTRAALAVWGATRAERTARWEQVKKVEDVLACEAEDRRAASLVHDAFYEDTKDVNSRTHARLLSPDDPWLRGLVLRETEAAAQGVEESP